MKVPMSSTRIFRGELVIFIPFKTPKQFYAESERRCWKVILVLLPKTTVGHLCLGRRDAQLRFTPPTQTYLSSV